MCGRDRERRGKGEGEVAVEVRQGSCPQVIEVANKCVGGQAR